MEAEEEKIVEHAKEAIHALTDKKKSWKAKIGSFLWEILIIIIAVNLTIWFHSWSEKRHERELEKEFLIGIRNNLEETRGILDGSASSMQYIVDYYDSVRIQMNEHRIDKSFINSNYWLLFATYYFIFDNSRFENFKSAGYLRLIENDSLLTKITYLYNFNFPFQAGADNTTFSDRKHDYITYIGSKARIDSSGTVHVSEILNNPEVKFQIFYQRTLLDERMRFKHEAARQAENVISDIDKELKDRFGYEFKKEEGKK